MMIKQVRLLIATCALTLAVFTSPAKAALVSQIEGLDIAGTLYNVTFHTNSSFNALWDADGDLIFGNDASQFNAAPLFWNDSTGALAATNAIVDYLGTTQSTVGLGSDTFHVPFEQVGIAVRVGQDSFSALTEDTPSTRLVVRDIEFAFYPYVSFEVAAVPVPAAAWLFASGLFGLIGVARRKMRT